VQDKTGALPPICPKKQADLPNVGLTATEDPLKLSFDGAELLYHPVPNAFGDSRPRCGPRFLGLCAAIFMKEEARKVKQDSVRLF
jgi:hypothetical protein